MCKTNKNIHINDSIPVIAHKMKLDSFLYSESGVKIRESYFNKYLRCGNLTPISNDTIRSMSNFSIQNYVDDCIKMKVFLGNKPTEPFLIGYLKSKQNKILPYKPEKYRGQDVFLALLELSTSTKCADDDYNTPFGEKPIMALKEMIKSYKGYSNFREFRKKSPLLKQIDRKSNKDFPCYGVAAIRTNSLLIKKAWNNGLIELKSYGED